MQRAHFPSGPTPPHVLRPLVLLLQWGREGMRTVGGRFPGRDSSSDVGGAVLLVGAITLAAMLGTPPLLTLGGGTGLAVLFVGARSWMVVQEQSRA